VEGKIIGVDTFSMPEDSGLSLADQDVFTSTARNIPTYQTFTFCLTPELIRGSYFILSHLLPTPPVPGQPGFTRLAQRQCRWCCRQSR
jgi:hypothetical protein